MRDVVSEFISLLNACVPLKCCLCQKPIVLSDGFFITQKGVYHIPCYYDTQGAFTERLVELKGKKHAKV